MSRAKSLVRLLKRMATDGPGVAREVFPPMRPSALVIGAQKSGTTALYRYLGRHPGVAPARAKELDFFQCDSRYRRGLDYYHAHFPRLTPRNRHKKTFDVTPGYMNGAAKGAPRIHRYNPDLLLIAVLRDPVARAFSGWQHYRRNCRTRAGWFQRWQKRCNEKLPEDFFAPRPRPFGEDFEMDMRDEIACLEQDRVIEMPILRLGMYAEHLGHYLRRFPREQLLVLQTETMKADTVAALRRIESFVGLQPHDWPPEEVKPESVGGYKDPIPQAARDLLRDFYRRQNRALCDLLDMTFSWAN